MALVTDYCLDALLDKIKEANALHICGTPPTTYAEATSTYTLGNETTITISAIGEGSPDGRKVTVSAITDGDVTDTGTAAHWALVDTANSRLLASNNLSSSQAVTTGNTFTLAAFNIRVKDAISE